MPLSWNEIRNRAFEFANEWEGETSEHAEAKSFLDSFFHVFGISRRRVATFEQRVKKIDGQDGYIDLLWKRTLLIEQKSQGKDLDRAHNQARDYFQGLKDEELPRYILVSDFSRFRLYDQDAGGEIVTEFRLCDLPFNIKYFAFMAGYQTTEIKPEDPVNIQAAEKMGALHDQLKAVGYVGHSLELYLVRLLFCLFAEDTGIFEKNLFRDFISLHTKEDGADLGSMLSHLFHVLNTAKENRLKNLPEQLADFEYINGSLFEETLPPASFDSKMRSMLLEACDLNWGTISPAIFGSLFQSVMNTEARRNLGAHYTSEANILKLIKPLFLDELHEEFQKVKSNKKKLEAFHSKLSSITFLDPACGCGNFLVITYRELRLLELEVLKVLYPSNQGALDIAQLIIVDVDQFYGIELEEFPAQIAQVAMWLIDHQMNLLVSEVFGRYFTRLPLMKCASINQGNALQIDWQSIVSKNKLSYILGNPPYGGSKFQSASQRAEMQTITQGINGSGILDYVSAWYLLAARYIQGTAIAVGFVSTSSITQGEQVGVLWSALLASYGVIISFAHRTFQWGSEARGRAAVHCVIIGFSKESRRHKRIFEYASPQSEPHEILASNINPYLFDGPNILIFKKSSPLCQVPEMNFGNQPIDGGNLILSPQDKDEFLRLEPNSAPYLRKFIGSEEFINGKERWCLWLIGISPAELRSLPHIIKRIARVKEFRLSSKRQATRALAESPAIFAFISHKDIDYILVPSVSSERRNFIPMGFMPSDVIASNLCLIIPEAGIYHFGILSSTMHMTWMRYTAGRLESRYRYSINIVYNNYPWPDSPTYAQKQAVEKAAQSVLKTRDQFSASTLADLYDPLTMPPSLVKAHQQLDRAVDKCYRPQPFVNELNRIAYLFNLYEKLLSN